LQSNNSYVWMLILFFGWSVAGAVSGFLVTQLGFPYTWITPLTVAMLGAVLFLVYRGYPIQAWMLAACVGFIVISIMAVARALTAPEPHVPEAYRAEFEATGQDTGLNLSMFDEYGDLYGGPDADYYVEYEPDRDAYLIAGGYPGVPTLVTIEFPPTQTAGGQWAFEEGSVRLRGAVSGTFEAISQQTWQNTSQDQFEPDNTMQDAYPEMLVRIPLPSGSMRRQIEVSAVITISYPSVTGAVETKPLTRDLTLTTIGSDYYTLYNEYRNWQRSRSVIDTPIWAVLLIGSVVTGAGSIVLVRRGALQPGTTSGLRVAIRRLSGTQQLGAELRELDRFRHLTDAQEGVFVGRVTAQSPAGRAGLRTGDVLIEFAGKPTNSPGMVNRLAKGRKKGESVEAVVLRDGQRVELRVRF